MTSPKTLIQMAGMEPTPSALSKSVVIVIDAQNEYLDGGLKLPGIKPALAEIAKLLERARKAQAPIIHVQHVGRPGGLFDVTAHNGHLIDEVAPDNDELIVQKSLPNAFARTSLDDLLKETTRKDIIITGFMTHMCVSATARAALDHGYQATVVASASATRDLPDPVSGKALDAAAIHATALAELSDRFATIARNVDEIPD